MNQNLKNHEEKVFIFSIDFLILFTESLLREFTWIYYRWTQSYQLNMTKKTVLIADIRKTARKSIGKREILIV